MESTRYLPAVLFSANVIIRKLALSGEASSGQNTRMYSLPLHEPSELALEGMLITVVCVWGVSGEGHVVSKMSYDDDDWGLRAPQQLRKDVLGEGCAVVKTIRFKSKNCKVLKYPKNGNHRAEIKHK